MLGGRDRELWSCSRPSGDEVSGGRSWRGGGGVRRATARIRFPTWPRTPRAVLGCIQGVYMPHAHPRTGSRPRRESTRGSVSAPISDPGAGSSGGDHGAEGLQMGSDPVWAFSARSTIAKKCTA